MTIVFLSIEKAYVQFDDGRRLMKAQAARKLLEEAAHKGIASVRAGTSR